MDRKVIITKRKEKIVTSIMEDDEIVEIHCSDETSDSEFCHALGNIYVGRVKNIVPNIGAAFIEIAPELPCYYSLEQNKESVFTHKIGKKPLCIGDELLVQISREASKTKAPTVNSKLEFTGQYVVLSVGNTKIGVSGKLDPDKKKHLRELMQPYQNDTYGFVVRTNAKEASDEEILAETEQLIAEYEKLIAIANTRTCFSCLRQAPKAYLTDLKNIYQDGAIEYKVEDVDLYEEMKEYLEKEQPQNVGKLQLHGTTSMSLVKQSDEKTSDSTDKLHQRKENVLSLDKLYGIETIIEKALNEHVWLKSGGYLIIQPTEALTVIDVNSGKFDAKKKSEDAYLKINLEAAKEAAKQIRLRNLSGIILIDFINMDNAEHMQTLLRSLRGFLSKDPIQTTLVDVTKLQLVEITRKKVRKMLYETV